MLSFKNAPLVGAERCCWCGNPWEDCQGNSLSPDARSKHKKLCHQKVIDRLKCGVPEVVADTKVLLDRLWSVTEVDDAEVTPKRPRDETYPEPTAFVVSDREIDTLIAPAAGRNGHRSSPDFLRAFHATDSESDAYINLLRKQ
jgi:hypothetical protein